MVAVIERLSNGRFEALRRFVARRAPAPDDEAERDLAVVERVARLASEADATAVDEPAASMATPFRAWLLTVTRYAAADHVRARLGWADSSEGGISKRGMGTDAERLDAVPEGADRPPITDYLTLKRLLDEIHGFLATLPQPMQSVVALWIEDESFEAIAARLSLEGPDKARALARAGQARLRERFRATWPELVARP
jgi:DNA-directed RNA polymerase specialized sigma24 family protein